MKVLSSYSLPSESDDESESDDSESDESRKQNEVDKYLFWTIGRSLGGHFGERKVSRNSSFRKNEIFFL